MPRARPSSRSGGEVYFQPFGLVAVVTDATVGGASRSPPAGTVTMKSRYSSAPAVIAPRNSPVRVRL